VLSAYNSNHYDGFVVVSTLIRMCKMTPRETTAIFYTSGYRT
jgi:hypothetical protein